MDPQEACQGPRGRIIGYQIKFQIGSLVDREKVNITACIAGRCNHSSNLLGDSVPSSYDRVSVAAESVVGVGAARNCTTQTVSELNLNILYYCKQLEWSLVVVLCNLYVILSHALKSVNLAT